MIKKLFLFCFFVVLTACKSGNITKSAPDYATIVIDTLLSDKLSCRALLVDEDKIWYASNGNKWGYLSLKDKNKSFQTTLKKDDLKLEFRSIAQTKNSVFILTVANPALLYRIDKRTLQTELVYQEQHEKVFYDAMLFMNEKEGIAIGDPTENCPSIIKTLDGGKTWMKLPCTTLPKFAAGESFFAASNTNLTYRAGKLFMVSGGKSANCYLSVDKGITWSKFETPIVQGQTMTGIFTSDFYDVSTGIVAGGNYEQLTQNTQNKAYTSDGGQTWKLVADGEAFGYASCIQFVPHTAGKALVATTATGVYYSKDAGASWKQLSAAKDFIAFRFINPNTIIASGKNRIVKMSLK